MTGTDTQKSKRGEVLEPTKAEQATSVGDSYIALIAQYTERPDLLIDAIERHDPGFIKRMNEKAEAAADQSRNARFHFGKRQAYAGLFVQIVAALAILGALFFALHKGYAGPGTIIALALFYAVAQSGSSGFINLANSIAALIRGSDAKNRKK